VPTVAIHTNVFEKAVQSVTRMHGMAEARYTFVPQPVMGKTAEQLRAYVNGKSPISGRPVMQEVVEGLTRPAEGDRLKEIKFERSTPRMVDSDTDDNLQRLFLENNWTDKLPIVLPREKRVAMLAHGPAGRSRRPSRSNQSPALSLPSASRVNAVMATRPEYFR
jgi:hypothetical protein